jgi:hypothetical protein
MLLSKRPALLCAVVVLLSFAACTAQDTTIVKIGLAGSTLRVPEDRSWRVNQAFISAGDGYNIQISTSNFKSEYTTAQFVSLPLYIVEMELLTKKDMVNYSLIIIESK